MKMKIQNKTITCKNQFYIDLTLNNSACKVCNIQDKRDCYHCSECDVCIKNHVQHSRLIGKCIGAGNKAPYKIFIFSSIIYLILWGVILIQSFVHSRNFN